MAEPLGIPSLGVQFGPTSASLTPPVSKLFDAAREGFLGGAIDWDTATIKVALVRNYTYNPAHRFVSEITAAGGVIHATSAALTGKTITDGAADAADLSITTIAHSSPHSLLILQSSAVTGGADVAASAQRVIAWITDGSLPLIPSGTSVDIQWDNGPLKIFSIWRNLGGVVAPEPPATIAVTMVGIGTAANMGAPSITVSGPSGGGGTVEDGWDITGSNVGLSGVGLVGANLPLYTGSSTPAAGTVIQDMRIESTLNLSNGNITIRRCLIAPASIGTGLPMISTSNGSLQPPAVAVTIEDCDITAAHLGDTPAGRSTGFWGVANLRRNKIWGMGTGIAILQSGNSLSCEVIGNYCYAMRSVGDGATTGNHCSAFTVRGFAAPGGRTMLVKGNRFDLTTANSSAAMFFQTYEGTIQNVTVDGNYLEGSGYNLVLEAYSGTTYTNMVCNNNRFRPTGYGPGYTSGDSWDVFTNNYRYDANGVDGRGAFIGGM